MASGSGEEKHISGGIRVAIDVRRHVTCVLHKVYTDTNISEVAHSQTALAIPAPARWRTMS